MAEIGIGLIGAGGIARYHANAYMDSPKARLIAVTDVATKAAKRIAGDYGTKSLSLDDLLNSPKIGAVSICTPPNTHAELAIRALQAGKHVLIEKPVAVSSEETDRIIQAAQETNLCAMVAHSHRYWPANVKAKALLESGAICTVLMVRDEILSHVEIKGELPWRFQRGPSGGGVVMNNGIHAIDRLRWWLGREVTSLQSRIWTVTEGSEVEDNAAISLVFDGNMIARVLLSSTAAPAAERCMAEFFGTHGVLQVETWGGITLSKRDGTTQEIAYDATQDAFHFEIADFLDAIETGGKSPVSLEDAKVSLEIVEQVYENATTNATSHKGA